MGLGDKAVVVSKQALLFEEFLAREAKAGRFALSLKPAGKPILLHGHCHQKAFGAVPPDPGGAAADPRAKPELIESSCCGMAGSFGYEASHYDVSMQMAEAACCQRCARTRMPSWWPTAPAAGTRLPMARSARRCMWRSCWTACGPDSAPWAFKTAA